MLCSISCLLPFRWVVSGKKHVFTLQWLGSFFKLPQLDPIGGMVLSTYIIVEWIKTLLLNFAHCRLQALPELCADRAVSGKSATPDHITRVLYLVTRFKAVVQVSDVEVYHIGYVITMGLLYLMSVMNMWSR